MDGLFSALTRCQGELRCVFKYDDDKPAPTSQESWQRKSMPALRLIVKVDVPISFECSFLLCHKYLCMKRDREWRGLPCENKACI